MPTVFLQQGATFEALEEESLLDAALRQGVSLPYSCRTGRCNTCKCRLVEGQTRLRHDELGLTEAEKQAGWILSCARAAVTDVVVQAQDLGGAVLPPRKTLPCRIDALGLCAPDVMRVMLRLPPSSDFAFLPGQYIEIIGPQGLRRSYSIANASAQGKQLELHIRAVPQGVLSRYWFEEAKAGDLLRLYGPLGTFFMRPCTGRDVIFLATGTGMAPVKAMLEALNAEAGALQQPRSVTVYWGGRTLSDLYWPGLNDFQGIRYVPVLSRADASWSGARGHVQDRALDDHAHFDQAVVYACGAEAMIRSAFSALTQAGLPAERFYADAFVCSASTEKENA